MEGIGDGQLASLIFEIAQIRRHQANRQDFVDPRADERPDQFFHLADLICMQHVGEVGRVPEFLAAKLCVLAVARDL